MYHDRILVFLIRSAQILSVSGFKRVLDGDFV